MFPTIIFDRIPDLADLTAFAFACASEHVRTAPGAPAERYMDEGAMPDRIWIWDTCFMAMFCKYAPRELPGIESLDNLYAPMLNHVKSPLHIHCPDNPPLFAWAEQQYYQVTGNRARLDRVFFEEKLIQRMYDVYENFHTGDKPEYMASPFPVQWEKLPLGYRWTGGRAGMDNTPRGDLPVTVQDNNPAFHKILYVDAAAQQALAARIVYEVTGDAVFKARYDELAELLNRWYWDEEDGCYYDIEAAEPHGRVKVMTPASYWPLLAGVASPAQASRMVAHATNPDELGGLIPFPSVARNSRHFDPAGGYWRGGVWLPTAYMGVKSVESAGYVKEADAMGEAIAYHMLRTWKDFEPHTIWETYCPTAFLPSTSKADSGRPWCRTDFCGWSALGPVSLVIENVLGFQADGVNKRVSWRLHQDCRHGIRNFMFGGVTADIIYDNGTVSVKTDAAFELAIAGKGSWRISAGETEISLNA